MVGEVFLDYVGEGVQGAVLEFLVCCKWGFGIGYFLYCLFELFLASGEVQRVVVGYVRGGRLEKVGARVGRCAGADAVRDGCVVGVVAVAGEDGADFPALGVEGGGEGEVRHCCCSRFVGSVDVKLLVTVDVNQWMDVSVSVDV